MLLKNEIHFKAPQSLFLTIQDDGEQMQAQDWINVDTVDWKYHRLFGLTIHWK